MAAASSMASMVPSHYSVLNLNLTAQRLTAYRSKGCPERCCSSMAVSVRNRVIGKAGSLASMLGRLSSSISSPYTTYVAAGALDPGDQEHAAGVRRLAYACGSQPWIPRGPGPRAIAADRSGGRGP
jgi:hypothetical protein